MIALWLGAGAAWAFWVMVGRVCWRYVRRGTS
jgi:hypothetical protein